jgi:hypothetical protein
MPGQQRDLPGDDPQLRTPGSPGLVLRPCRHACQHVLRRAPEVHFDQLAGGIVEQQNWRCRAPVQDFLHFRDHNRQFAGSDQTRAFKGCTQEVRLEMHCITRIK